MPDFQKVRVTFKDADGRQVSAAMWGDNGGVLINWNNRDVRPANYLYMEHGKDVKVETINELPTGVGAVIRALGVSARYGDVRDVYITDQSGVWWSNNDGDVASKEEIEHEWIFEVLSEGIEL